MITAQRAAPDEVLRALGLTARGLFEAYVLGRRESERERLAGRVDLVAGPGQPAEGLTQADDLLVRGALGEGSAWLFVLVDGELYDLRTATRVGLDPEGRLPGRYAWVVEGGLAPRSSADRFARRVTDPRGYMPRDQALVRLAPDALVSAPPAETAGFLAETAGFLPETPALAALESRYFPPSGTLDAAPTSRASTVEAIVDGQDFFAQIKKNADSLKKGDAWYITGWWLHTSFAFSGGRKLGDLLVEKAGLGVDVRVIAWANANAVTSGIPSNYAAVCKDNIRSIETLRAAKDASGATPLNGRVLLDWSGDLATAQHMKINVFSIEGKVSAFVGGIDYEQDRLDGPMHRTGTRKWHDAAARVTGTAAARVLGTFETRWTEAATLSAMTYNIGAGKKAYNPPPLTALTLPPVGPALAQSSDTSVQIARTWPAIKEWYLTKSNVDWKTLPKDGVHEVRRTFQTMLFAARRFIYIEDQAFDAVKSLFPSLVAACKRGVKIIVVTRGVKDPIDGGGRVASTLTSAVNDGILDKLTPAQRENLVVCILDGIFVHSKLVLIDDELMSIGSANFMDRSMQDTSEGEDTECTVVAVSTGKLVPDLRVKLWAEHIRVSGAGPQAELRDLSKSLGFWHKPWGSGVTFATPKDCPLVWVWPPKAGKGLKGGGSSGGSGSP